MTKDPPRLLVRDDDEAQQVSAARTDPQAFGALYDRYAPSVYRYLLSRLGNIEEAKDVTSQTFLAAIEAFPRYRHNGHFSAWLFSIARGKYVNHVRKAVSRSRTPERSDLDLLDDPLQQAVNSERLSELKKLIQRLHEDEQELLRLRFVAGLSFSDIASIVKRNEDAVKKTLYRLLARLQSQMER